MKAFRAPNFLWAESKMRAILAAHTGHLLWKTWLSEPRVWKMDLRAMESHS